jgi:hypothetical protein
MPPGLNINVSPRSQDVVNSFRRDLVQPEPMLFKPDRSFLFNLMILFKVSPG